LGLGGETASESEIERYNKKQQSEANRQKSGTGSNGQNRDGSSDGMMDSYNKAGYSEAGDKRYKGKGEGWSRDRQYNSRSSERYNQPDNADQAKYFFTSKEECP